VEGFGVLVRAVFCHGADGAMLFVNGLRVSAEAKIGAAVNEFPQAQLRGRADIIHVRMPDGTPTLEPKPYISLFTRLAAVEVELYGLARLVAGLKADHDATRKDRDEWRWRAERLLADQERGFLGRLSNRAEADFGRIIAHLWTLVRGLLTTILQAINRTPFWFARLKLDEPQDDATVTLAGTAHDSHPVHDGRLDLSIPP
jgi:hypothetical protein